MSREEAAEEARKVMNRAIRRLNVFEYVLLAMAGVLALVGGALAAWALQAALGFPFRAAWAACSLLLFIVPGVVVLGRERRARGAHPIRATETERIQGDDERPR